MTPLEKDKLESLCDKWGLKELNFTKGIFIDDNTGITMSLRGDNPVVGVTIAGTLHTEGHGNMKVPDLQIEVDQIMKAKPIPKPKSSGSMPITEKSKDITEADTLIQTKDRTGNKSVGTDTGGTSSSTDLSAPLTKGEAKGSNPASGGIDKGETPIPGESKLGTPDTKKGIELESKKGKTSGICDVCKTKFDTTLSIIYNTVDKYGKILCPACIDKEGGIHENKTEDKEASKDKETKGNIPTTSAKPAAIKICNVCGLELSGARALECFQRDPQKPIMICVDCECKIKPEEPTVIKGKSMSGELTPTKPGANVPVKKSDQERDDEIELAKAERFLKNQGSSYSVSGKNRPDSAMVQKFANTVGISSEIIFAEQTKDYAHVVVRGHRGDSYIDAVVHHDFETEFQLQTMEIIKKNPEILDHYDGLLPVIKEGAKIESGNKVVDAKYYLIHTLLSFKTFSLRDATTKAMSIAQMKLLNQDAREPEEVASEQKERDLVDDKRIQRR